MNNIDTDGYYIIPQLPSYGFPCKNNRNGTCGQHVLKTIIEAWHGQPFRTREEYSLNWRNKATGNMMPRHIKKVLDKYGLASKYFYCLFKRNSIKIEKLKSYLKKGPVILLISHAYDSKKDFDFARALTKQHYISLRGYNDKEKIFYVYDSNVERENGNNNFLPAGNLTISYNKLIWYWRLGMWGLHRNFGIAVTYKK